MRAMWKGSISFGLVNIPIKLYSATDSKSVKFRQLHKKCKHPIKYEKVCPVCKEEVNPEDIVRGYEYEKGRFVVIEDKDLEKIPDETTRTIDILDFVDLKEIDPIFYDRSYFLAPEATGDKAYVLLRKAMEESGKIAIAKVVIRSKQNLACIRVYEKGYLVMETMYYPDEIRSVENIPQIKEPKIHKNEIKMANQLIDSLTEKFDPEKYTDEYRETLIKIIHAKIEDKDVEIPEAKEEKVIDLMEALKASLDAAQKQTKQKKQKQTKQKTKTG